MHKEINMLRNPIQEFIDSLDEREKVIREMYVQTNGDMVSIATKLGISKGQANRLVSRVYFKAMKYAGELQQKEREE